VDSPSSICKWKRAPQAVKYASNTLWLPKQSAAFSAPPVKSASQGPETFLEAFAVLKMQPQGGGGEKVA